MSFETAIAFVLRHEGEASDDPRDHGGVTKYGISARAYPLLDIAALTREQAITIYRRDYWERIQGDALPPSVALLLFDAAVNQGPRRAIAWLQHAVGAKPDGIMGPDTLERVRVVDRRATLAEFTARRAYAYGSTTTFSTFGLGWSRRLVDALLTAQEMET